MNSCLGDKGRVGMKLNNDKKKSDGKFDRNQSAGYITIFNNGECVPEFKCSP